MPHLQTQIKISPTVKTALIVWTVGIVIAGSSFAVATAIIKKSKKVTPLSSSLVTLTTNTGASSQSLTCTTASCGSISLLAKRTGLDGASSAILSIEENHDITITSASVWTKATAVPSAVCSGKTACTKSASIVIIKPGTYNYRACVSYSSTKSCSSTVAVTAKLPKADLNAPVVAFKPASLAFVVGEKVKVYANASDTDDNIITQVGVELFKNGISQQDIRSECSEKTSQCSATIEVAAPKSPGIYLLGGKAISDGVNYPNGFANTITIIVLSKNQAIYKELVSKLLETNAESKPQGILDLISFASDSKVPINDLMAILKNNSMVVINGTLVLSYPLEALQVYSVAYDATNPIKKLLSSPYRSWFSSIIVPALRNNAIKVRWGSCMGFDVLACYYYEKNYVEIPKPINLVNKIDRMMIVHELIHALQDGLKKTVSDQDREMEAYLAMEEYLMRTDGQLVEVSDGTYKIRAASFDVLNEEIKTRKNYSFWNIFKEIVLFQRARENASLGKNQWNNIVLGKKNLSKMKAEDVILIVDSTIEDLESQAKSMWSDVMGFNAVSNEKIKYDLIDKVTTGDGF